MFCWVFGPSCSVEILSVTGRTPGDASVSPVSSAPRLHLSSGCLRCPEDVTWPTPGNSSLCWFQTMLCVLLQVLKDRSPLLSWLRLAFTPASKQPALSNKMSPHKMNMSRRLGVYQTSYRELRVEQGSQKTDWLRTLCITLRLLPSTDMYQNQQAFKADFQTVNFSFRELNGSQLKLLQESLRVQSGFYRILM